MYLFFSHLISLFIAYHFYCSIEFINVKNRYIYIYIYIYIYLLHTFTISGAILHRASSAHAGSVLVLLPGLSLIAAYWIHKIMLVMVIDKSYHGMMHVCMPNTVLENKWQRTNHDLSLAGILGWVLNWPNLFLCWLDSVLQKTSKMIWSMYSILYCLGSCSR